jgi:hypothetical protein
MVAGLLRAASMPTVARWAAPRRQPWAVPRPVRAVVITDRVLRVNRGPLRANCVVRSLVLLRYLPDRASLVLKVGVRPGVRPVDGHAWLERDGEPVAERVDPRGEYLVTWEWR